jgi:hypothetical protein
MDASVSKAYRKLDAEANLLSSWLVVVSCSIIYTALHLLAADHDALMMSC